MAMKLLLTKDGALTGLAQADPGWVVPTGGQVLDAPLTFADLDAAEAARVAAPQPAELAYDATQRALVVRAYTPTADERARMDTRATILATAQGAVGKALAALTAAERTALATVLLWRFGAVTPQGTIAALDKWADGPVRG